MREFIAWCFAMERGGFVQFAAFIAVAALTVAALAITGWLVLLGMWAVAMALWLGVPIYFLAGEYSFYKKQRRDK